MIIGLNLRTKKYIVRCDKCGDESEYSMLRYAEKNSKRCLFCRRPEPETVFGRWYRKNLNEPTKSFRHWKRLNARGKDNRSTKGRQ